jgi:hypothetical protein
LSSHPAFAPAFILWCGAMLGLPVLAISGAALESWVAGAHIDSLLPAAAPPLGATARLMLAAGFALVGAAVGWGVTRMLRPGPLREGDEIQLRQRDRHPDAPARRPISAHAELGDEGLGGLTGDRDLFPDDLSPYRAPVEETPRQGGFIHEPAPWRAPTMPPAMPVAAEATPVFAAPAITLAPQIAAAPAAASRDRLHEDAYDLPEIDFGGLMDTSAVVAEEETPAPQALPSPEPTEDDWHALPPVVSETDLRRTSGRMLTAVPAPVVPIASALSRRAAENRPVEKLTPVETPALIGATPVQPRASASERIGQASLGELSHVELIERLALAIHTREKGVTPVAVNDAQDSEGDAAAQDGHDDVSATQANLRSALAGLREVK